MLPHTAKRMMMMGSRGPSSLLTSLMGYWKLEEASGVRVDATGRGNDLAETGTPIRDTGKQGYAGKFEGGEYVSKATNADLSFFNKSWTIAAWVNGNPVNSAIIAKGDTAPDLTNIEISLVTNAVPQFQINIWVGGAAQVLAATSFGALSPATWYFVVAWLDLAGGTFNIQVNNGTVDSDVLGTVIPNGNDPFAIGAYADGLASFIGLVDEVGKWDRVLTAAERTTLYNGGSGNTYPFDVDAAAPAYVRVNTNIGGQIAMILEPGTYKPREALPLVMYHHGISETQTALLTDALKAGVVSALLAGGYLLVGSNAHGDNWGNDDSLADYSTLFTTLAVRYNISRVIHFSQSMGGESGLLSLSAGVGAAKCKGWIGIYPTCDLAWCYAQPGFTASVDTAFGINGTPYAVATSGHDPVLLTDTNFNSYRMRFYASAGDTSVLKVNNSDAMAALVTGHATEHDVVVCTGDHGDPSHFQPADFVAFCDRCI